MAKAKVEMQVEGMTCQGCVRSIEKKLSGVHGVDYAHVNLGAGHVTVEFDDVQTNPQALVSAVEQIGFHASQT
jgi:copper ion binding protein